MKGNRIPAPLKYSKLAIVPCLKSEPNVAVHLLAVRSASLP